MNAINRQKIVLLYALHKLTLSRNAVMKQGVSDITFRKTEIISLKVK